MTTSPDDRLTAALVNLEQSWREADPALGAGLGPGHTDAELADIEAQTGLTLPREARILLGWHAPKDGLLGRIGPTGQYLLTKAEALEAYRFLVQAGIETSQASGLPAEVTFWGASWFPIMSGSDGSYVGIDCADTDGGSSPIYQTLKAGEPVQVAASLVEVVEWWAELQDAGVYRRLADGTWALDDLSNPDLVRKYRMVA